MFVCADLLIYANKVFDKSPRRLLTILISWLGRDEEVLGCIKEGTWNLDWSDWHGTIFILVYPLKPLHKSLRYISLVIFIVLWGAKIFCILKWICIVAWLSKQKKILFDVIHLIWWFFARISVVQLQFSCYLQSRLQVQAICLFNATLSSQLFISLKKICNQLLLLRIWYIHLSDTYLCPVWKIDYWHVSHICLCFMC
jgi:hypothetical protein